MTSVESPEATREGDAYVYHWPTSRVVVEIDQVVEHHRDIHGEMTVHFLNDANERAHVAGPTRYNLIGPRARSDAARAVCAIDRYDGALESWERRVEQAFVLTVRQVREGTPAVILSNRQGRIQRRWLMEPLLALDETTLVYADGGTGKGYLALWLAAYLRHAHDDPRLPWRPPQVPVTTLYCDWETHEAPILRRWQRLCSGLGVDGELKLAYLQMRRSLLAEANRVRHQVRAVNAQFVVIDSVGFAVESELTSAEAATRLFGVCNDLGVPTLLLHHMNKRVVHQKEGEGDPYGTIYFKNAARAAWEMRGEQQGADDTVISLKHVKTNEGALLQGTTVLRLHFDGPEGPVSVTQGDIHATADLNARRPLRERLVDLLHERARTLRECLEPLELDEREMNRLQVQANRLLRSGQLVKLPDNRWGLPAYRQNVVEWRPRDDETDVQQDLDGEPLSVDEMADPPF